jgi:hypothetical protein
LQIWANMAPFYARYTDRTIKSYFYVHLQCKYTLMGIWINDLKFLWQWRWPLHQTSTSFQILFSQTFIKMTTSVFLVSGCTISGEVDISGSHFVWQVHCQVRRLVIWSTPDGSIHLWTSPISRYISGIQKHQLKFECDCTETAYLKGILFARTTIFFCNNCE